MFPLIWNLEQTNENVCLSCLSLEEEDQFSSEFNNPER